MSHPHTFDLGFSGSATGLTSAAHDALVRTVRLVLRRWSRSRLCIPPSCFGLRAHHGDCLGADVYFDALIRSLPFILSEQGPSHALPTLTSIHIHPGSVARHVGSPDGSRTLAYVEDHELRAHCPDPLTPDLRHPSERASDVLHPIIPTLARNRVIVALSNVMICCPESPTERQRSGTWSVVRLCRRSLVSSLGLDSLFLVLPDGTVTEELSQA